jgi:hypothetical protein
MAGFISNAQKEAIKGIVDRIHETFARPIIVYRFGQKVSFYNNLNYNKLYKKSSPIEQQNLSQNSKTIMARIQYKNFDQRDFFQNSTQEKIVIPEGTIYLKVDREAYLYMHDAKTVEFDERTFSIQSPGQPLGMFGPQYYKFLLIPLES